MLWEKETSIVTLGWPKRLGRKDVRVPESLLFAVVCSKPRVPSALCCDGDTASGRGDVLGHGWHRDCRSVPRSKGGCQLSRGSFPAL